MDKLKAVLTTGILGAGLGALLGVVAFGVAGVVGGTFSWIGLLGGAGALAGFGGLSGTAFAAALAASTKGELDDLSVAKSGLLGFLAGGTFAAITAAVAYRMVGPLEVDTLSWVAAFFGVLGGGLSAGLVAVAKSTRSSELGPADDVAVLPPEAGR